MHLRAASFSYVLLGQATSDGIGSKWENNGYITVWINDGRVIGINIKTHYYYFTFFSCSPIHKIQTILFFLWYFNITFNIALEECGI